jgi:sulfite reductase (NADPH) flavoprotein alpha-component
MFRSLHRWFGLIAGALVVILAISGAALSVFPAADAISSPASGGITVAQLASRVEAAHPAIDEIKRAPSGRITAYYTEGDQQVAAVVDPETGASLGEATESPLLRWLTNLHRSLFLGDGGRIVTALGAASMLLLTAFGLVVMARRAGGWRFILKPVRGTGDGRLHTVTSRLALPGLLLSSLTALWMTASTFGLLPEGAGAPAFPAEVSGRTGVALGTVEILKETPVSALRSLTFPASGDATDAFALKTETGQGYIDQGSGELLAWQDANWVDRIGQIVMMLHTGRGFATLGLLLGLSALSVPILSWTGLTVWLRGRGKHKTVSRPAREADTIVLVASEGGTTWGFAETLRDALSSHGASVHIGQLAHFDPSHWPQAKRVILFAATYGDGAAPASAEGFQEQFAKIPAKPGLQLAILGFGDRSFPAFCGFAAEIARIADARGWQSLVPYDTIDRQSPQDFARWGQALGHALGLELALNHQPEVPTTWTLALISRRDFGANVQATTSILRFALPKSSLWQRLTGRGFPRFEAGDLVGVVPQGSALPRFYSLASGSADGFIEICVRRQAGGLCSNQLTRMEPGQTISSFVRANAGFRPKRNRKPVILIGAGAGIAPLAGFARANHRHQPLHLYFGTRHPEADALYAEELVGWNSDGRLSDFSVAFSRTATPAYVQDLLRKDAARLRKLLAAGGQVLVCGGRDMAAGVSKAIAEIVAPQGLTLATLKAEGRYAEDVF